MVVFLHLCHGSVPICNRIIRTMDIHCMSLSISTRQHAQCMHACMLGRMAPCTRHAGPARTTREGEKGCRMHDAIRKLSNLGILARSDYGWCAQKARWRGGRAVRRGAASTGACAPMVADASRSFMSCKPCSVNPRNLAARGRRAQAMHARSVGRGPHAPGAADAWAKAPRCVRWGRWRCGRAGWRTRICHGAVWFGWCAGTDPRRMA